MNSEFAEIITIIKHLETVIDTSQIMLVGARCRDIYQKEYMGFKTARRTKDIDFAFALESWDGFEALKKAFPSPQGAWQEICVAGMHVDIVPFGPIEEPPGEVGSDDGFVLNVAGLKEVFEGAVPYRLDTHTEILLPTFPGLAAMKFHSWLDRKDRGVYKDATDIALFFSWMEKDEELLYERYVEAGPEEFLGVPEVMAAYLLGMDVRNVLGAAQGAFLLERLESEDESSLQLFANKLGTLEGSALPYGIRREQVRAFIGGMRGGSK